MAQSHFAIERPRRISISITGYDPKAQTAAQAKKLGEQRRRKAKRQKGIAADAAAASQLAASAAAAEVEALSVASSATDPVDDIEWQIAHAMDAIDHERRSGLGDPAAPALPGYLRALEARFAGSTP